jgi:hypothetical protein
VESRTKKGILVKEILLAGMTTGMLDSEQHVRTPMAEEVCVMGELEPHTFIPESGAEDESGPACFP